MRGVIKGVLAQELKNSLSMQEGYEREIKNLPSGCLSKKVIRGHEYYYLVKREGKKVVYQVKKQVRYLKGTLRGKEPV